VLTRAEEADKRAQELQKKNDDYKRAYNDAKVNLNKALGDLDRAKKGPEEKPPSESEVREKYESLKIKFKVSSHTMKRRR